MKLITLILILLSINCFSQSSKVNNLYNSINNYGVLCNDKKGDNTFFKTVNQLFGIAGQVMYTFESAKYSYYTDDGNSLFSESKYQTTEIMAHFDVSTPIINFAKSYNINKFSNSNVDTDFEKTHIDFFGLHRLGMFLNKSKEDELAMAWYLMEMLLPIYDRREIKSDYYNSDYYRIGILYNLFSYQNTNKSISNVSFISNNTKIDNCNVDISINKYYIFDMQGFFNLIRLMKYNFHKLYTSMGKFEEGEKYNMFPILKYIPTPFINLYLGDGHLKVTDSNGNVIENRYIPAGGADFGIQYSGLITFSNFNMIIIPELLWQKGKNYSLNEAIEQELNGEVRNNYFSVHLGVQFFF